MTQPDYSAHDARLSKTIVFGNSRPRRGLWGWNCIVCHASAEGFEDHRAATADAERHNGGPYNYRKGNEDD